MRVTPVAERAVREGHPWVFENSIREVSREGAAGDVAVLFDRKNRFLAVGLFDPDSPIRVRILSAGAPAKVGRALFRTRLDEAIALRRPLIDDPDTTGYRLLSGEGDRMPGLVVDRYGAGLVIQSHSRAWLPWLRDLVPLLLDASGATTIIHLPSRQLSASPHTPESLRAPALMAGEPPKDGFRFTEGGLHFVAHPLEGHKTGFYLDQRENRARVRKLARGRRVLNLFSYTGGFSVAAAGGAARIVSVDMSEPALLQAERHFDLNRELGTIGSVEHETRAGDAFRILEQMGQSGETFDLVIIDPPSFARERGQEAGALRAYSSLTGLALPLVEPSGLLVQASCTARIDADTFFGTVLNTATSEGRPLEVV